MDWRLVAHGAGPRRSFSHWRGRRETQEEEVTESWETVNHIKEEEVTWQLVEQRAECLSWFWWSGELQVISSSTSFCRALLKTPKHSSWSFVWIWARSHQNSTTKEQKILNQRRKCSRAPAAAVQTGSVRCCCWVFLCKLLLPVGCRGQQLILKKMSPCGFLDIYVWFIHTTITGVCSGWTAVS